MKNKQSYNSKPDQASKWERGKFFVFEGPDGTGKSTLSQMLAAHLKKSGISVKHLSFPGREDGTLGKLVYQLHHEPDSLGVATLSPASRQALHIAAHLDAIERVIFPALECGECVILDRFWWSTWVYGVVDGVNKDLLRALLQAEQAQWGRVLPTVAFLMQNDSSFRDDEPTKNWQELASVYRELAEVEGAKHDVHIVTNDASIEDIFEKVLAVIDGQRHKDHENATHTNNKNSGRPLKAVEPASKNKTIPKVRKQALISSNKLQTSEAYDTYWKFAVERQAIFFRRLQGEPGPWTQDPILQQHKFTNAYRASDRVSQYLIRHVIYGGEQSSAVSDPDDIFFRVLLFKVFNRISTWQQLEQELGHISYAEYSFNRYDKILLDAKARGERIFSSAYIMPTGVSTFGYSDKHRNFFQLIERMIEDGVPWRLTELKTMREAFELLLTYPLIGAFLAYQYVIDLNYSPLTDFSENDFVMPGPGARDGIAKCFPGTGDMSEADIIRWVTERQGEEFERLGLSFQDLWGRPLQLIDCQNLFCEVDKYSRMAHPHITGLSGRTRIKQKFQPTVDRITYWYPPKWNINERILVDLQTHQKTASDHDSRSKTPALPFTEK